MKERKKEKKKKTKNKYFLLKKSNKINCYYYIIQCYNISVYFVNSLLSLIIRAVAIKYHILFDEKIYRRYKKQFNVSYIFKINKIFIYKIGVRKAILYFII